VNVALSDDPTAVRLPDWPCTHPLALPTVIRTVNIVLHEGATLVQESGPARRALSPGTGYRNLTPTRDRAQAGYGSTRTRIPRDAWQSSPVFAFTET
jgi:hypothetical protein